jgi:bifunctional ADP-heptose synthase (sugar kinase/adenylyltransferase)
MDVEGRGSSLIEVISQNLPGGKSIKTSVNLANFSGEIPIQHLPNMFKELYPD